MEWIQAQMRVPWPSEAIPSIQDRKSASQMTWFCLLCKNGGERSGKFRELLHGDKATNSSDGG
jgi:hypothetical protein